MMVLNIFLIASLLISLGASLFVRITYWKYSKRMNERGITGAEAANQMLLEHGLNFVSIEQIPGKLNDYYSPKANTIYLSEEVFASSSVAAIGIAMHEAGHAIQYAEEYTPIRIRNAIVRTTNISSYASYLLTMIGIVATSPNLIKIGIVLFFAVIAFQLITLPVEFNASHRAIENIRSGGILTVEEQKGAKKMLFAAAMTYVAALATALLNLLRLMMILQSFTGGGKRKR